MDDVEIHYDHRANKWKSQQELVHENNSLPVQKVHQAVGAQKPQSENFMM